MPDETRAEYLSKAYVRAIAARAGANIHIPEVDYGVDMAFTRVKRHSSGLTDMPDIPLRCQIKSSKDCKLRGDDIVYDLKVKNYNDLINSSSTVLIVLWLPFTIDEWIMQDANCLTVFKCAYYFEISDRTEISNKSKKQILIPKSQVFTEEALLRLIDKAQKGLQAL